jgi:hypothetical protein
VPAPASPNASGPIAASSTSTFGKKEIDTDKDGIPDYADPDSPDYQPPPAGQDADGDGIANRYDDDDGDGIMNSKDDDRDGDGITNWEDPDIIGDDDGDGILNNGDKDSPHYVGCW